MSSEQLKHVHVVDKTLYSPISWVIERKHWPEVNLLNLLNGINCFMPLENFLYP